MTTAGEAASLFGSPDPALDPFAAALGGDDTREEPHSNAVASDAVADLFGSATDPFPVDGGDTVGAPATEPQQAWYDPAGQQSYAYGAPAANAYAPTYPEQPTYQQNGAYAAYAQPQYAPAPAAIASAYEPTYAPQQSYAPQTYSAYSQTAPSYAPQTTVHPAPAAQANTYVPSAYDPYKPAQTQSSYELPAQPAAPATRSAYDPYQPAYPVAPSTYEPSTQHSSYAPYGASSHAAPHVNPVVAVPPPPAPIVDTPPPAPAVSAAEAVTAYRPKKANAFDPPLPPIKASKHIRIPPRQTYASPPPVSPPASIPVTQPLQPPPRGPPRTPDLYAPPTAVRRDAYPSHTEVSPQKHDAYAPSLPNGSSQPSAYAPSYNSMSNGAAYGPTSHSVSGPPAGSHAYGSVAAPPTQPPQPSHASGFSQPVNGHVTGYAGVSPRAEQDHIDSVFGSGRVASPPHAQLDSEDVTPQADQFGFVKQEPARSPPPASPPRSIRSPTSPRSGHASPTYHGPSSPERSRSPRKPSSITSASPPSGRAFSPPSDPYALPPKPEVNDRAKSPTSSIRSAQGSVGQSYEPPPRRGSGSAAAPPSYARPLSSLSRRSTLSNQYDPQQAADPKRTASPAGSVRSVTAPKQAVYDPYNPQDKSGASPPAHVRSTSNGSAYSNTSVADPYAPSRFPTRSSNEQTYSSFALPTQGNAYVPSAASYDRLGGQVVTLAAPVHSTYAPSPSLLGTNDPLGRTAARVPVVSFGFGGKLVTCFHGASMNTGFDVALSARQSTDIKIHSLKQLIPESAVDTSAASYPGPLFSDPGSPTTSLVRTGATQLKTKKARVVKYLEERAEEIKSGLGYHRAGSVDRSRAEAKRILVLLLKAMVENDGRLSGSAEVDAAVRTALLPDLEGPITTSESSGIIPASSSDLLIGSQFGLPSALPNTHDYTVATNVVRSSQLDKIQDLLAKGDRRGACHYAADEKLWPHALVIASSIGKDTWKEVVTEWVRAELAKGSSQTQGDVTEGREGLRVAYSLYGGNGAASVQELVAPSTLIQHPQTLQIPQPPQPSITPITPSFPIVQPLNVPAEVLANWSKTTAMMLSNPSTPDSSSALTAFGDQLSMHQWIEASHVCYMLSPQTSPMSVMGSHPRLTLLGSPSAAVSPTYYKDSDPIIFSEIAEFAMSLATPAKGQEAFIGFPHLQPYKLFRAMCLAEMGHVQQANRYCEAISNSLNRGTPCINMSFIEQLKTLSDRLTAAPQLDKSGSWIPGKMSKPSLDSIGNWLEGRFTKFIAGDGESPRPEEAQGMAQQQQSHGPFANFSSISSATTSAYPSPHQSVTDLTEMSNPPPPFRAGSAMGARPPSRSMMPINRASSAMDHVRPFQRTGSPIARVASASAATFADAASYGQPRSSPYAYGNGNGYAPSHASDHLRPEGSSHDDVSAYGGHSKPPNTGSWWGASDSDAATPTASSFGEMHDQPASDASNSGFISLMDDPMLSMTPTATKQQGSPLPRPSHTALAEEEDDDDLGLGNSAFRARKAEQSEGGEAAEGAKEEKPKGAEPQRPEVKQAPSSGWLSRLWKRNEPMPTAAAPVKANLGEESSFYYDKELKRWVNKNASGETAKPAAPAPPPRSQTASPGRSFGAAPPPSPLGPPPARPATAHPIDLTAEPPRRAPPPRVRSNLVPSDAEGLSAPPSPMPPSSGTPTPPPGGGPPRTGSARPGAKRNVRSRYVDVFSQEAGGA
ncbi:Sec23-binding domain of Sec16-domain-containing protein [Lenzites betulinus]|nr:Sec23-binding domain of Sec16-domain-containing protein [Lenzites betulinus]